MAKQAGVSGEAIAGLQDPGRFPFPPEVQTALRFAEAMTRGPGDVPDGLFQEMRRHFTEPQIVETALHTEITRSGSDAG